MVGGMIMLRWILQVFAIGIAGYVAYQNRYRLLNVAMANKNVRHFLVSRSLNLPMIRNWMMQSVFSGKDTKNIM